MRIWRNTGKLLNESDSQLTSYLIEIKTKKSSAELVFEELWIDEKKYKFHLSRENRKIAESFAEKEVLKLNIISEITSPLIDPTVKSSKGILLLGYSFRNKRKYLSIKKFRDIDELHLCETHF